MEVDTLREVRVGGENVCDGVEGELLHLVYSLVCEGRWGICSGSSADGVLEGYSLPLGWCGDR